MEGWLEGEREDWRVTWRVVNSSDWLLGGWGMGLKAYSTSSVVERDERLLESGE